ncbi:MAG: YncE family protein [Candidatus Limnocylindria bacterium]
MRSRATFGAALALALVLSSAAGGGRSVSADPGSFEVWAIDQSGTAGRLYIYDGGALTANAATAIPETIDLATAVAPLCVSQTGSSPTRAHMLLFSPTFSHAILAYVATGHVVFIDAATRAPVGCIDVGAQAHAAFPSPDGGFVIVANQNGKLLQRIVTDYDSNTFTLDAAATLNLATCATPNGAPCEDPVLRPDNAPICPILDTSGRLGFVTLRGGGLFVVDVTDTPMRIVAEYDKANVHPNGCGGIQKARTMYVNAGGGTAGTPREAHVYAFDLRAYPRRGFNAPNVPAPETVFGHHSGDHDSHGAARIGRFAWFADRFANTVEVVDTVRDSHVGAFTLAGAVSADPAPDLLDVAPGGGFVFASLRGPCPLTANLAGVNNAVGATPGVGVIAVHRGGVSGTLVGIAPIHNIDPSGTSCAPAGAPASTDRADPHALRVRPK